MQTAYITHPECLRHDNDAIYNDLNSDGDPGNDVDMVFNNPGGLRADISCAAYPCVMTYGMLYSILPFGNQTVVGEMKGAQITELLNQAASLNKGAKPAGMRYKFYNYRVDTDPTSAVNYKAWSWGAFDPCVIDKTSELCEPLDLNQTYRIATNEFLAPAGQDNFYAFKYVTNISYLGDMLDGVIRWVKAAYPESAHTTVCWTGASRAMVMILGQHKTTPTSWPGCAASGPPTTCARWRRPRPRNPPDRVAS